MRIYAFEDVPKEITLLTCHIMAQHLRHCCENPNNWAVGLLLLQLCCLTFSEWCLCIWFGCMLTKSFSQMRKVVWNLPWNMTF